MSDLKQNPNPGVGIAHEFDCTHDPCRCNERAKTFWNIVTLGDGTKARLHPSGCLNRIIEADGHYSCNHGDHSPCDRTGHETIELYEVVRIEPVAAVVYTDTCPECGQDVGDGTCTHKWHFTQEWR